MIIKEIKPEDTWPIRQIVMWPEKSIEFIKIKEDKNALHYGLFKDDILVSVISCFESNGEIQFRKFATVTYLQKQGFGSVLLNFIINEVKKRGVKRLWCSSRPDKMTFYEKFGLRATNERFLKNGIEFIIMEIGFD